MGIKNRSEIVRVDRICVEKRSMNFSRMFKFGNELIEKNNVYVSPPASNFPIDKLKEGQKYLMVSIQNDTTWYLLQTTDAHGNIILDQGLLTYALQHSGLSS